MMHAQIPADHAPQGVPPTDSEGLIPPPNLRFEGPLL